MIDYSTQSSANIADKIFTQFADALDDIVVEFSPEEQARTLAEFREYRFRPVDFVVGKLGYIPWSGAQWGAIGQKEILEIYAETLKRLHDRQAHREGRWGDEYERLSDWEPGEIIRNIIAIDSGHTTGKTAVASWIVIHFYMTCFPSVGYSFAPTLPQLKDLLWKEIAVNRQRAMMPGKHSILQSRLAPNHFITGRAISNSNSNGTERVQGQHEYYQSFVLDESNDIPGFVFDAIDSMKDNNICVVVSLRNPKNMTCKAHQIRGNHDVQALRISCLDHPNVRTGKVTVPGAVTRDYVVNMINKHCTVVDAHNEDEYTFEIDWIPGKIFRPNFEFLFRVMGIAAEGMSSDTFCPLGRFDKMLSRTQPAINRSDADSASIGVDPARLGTDTGAIYYLHNDVLHRWERLQGQRQTEYFISVKKLCKHLDKLGVTNVSIRIDAGGGYGSFVDWIMIDHELNQMFDVFNLHEVHFNSEAYDGEHYANFITEAYYILGEAIREIAIDSTNGIREFESLRQDVCQRQFEFRRKGMYDTKALIPKEKFRSLHGRSPDEGDGAALAVYPEIYMEKVIQYQRTLDFGKRV